MSLWDDTMASHLLEGVASHLTGAHSPTMPERAGLMRARRLSSRRRKVPQALIEAPMAALMLAERSAWLERSAVGATSMRYAARC